MIATVYSINLEQLLPALDAWITSVERECAQILHRNPLRQQQYLAGRGLLRWLVCTIWNCDLRTVTIVRRNNGAPLLVVAGQPWHCSISHTNGAVCVAASPQFLVGVDVERMLPRQRLVTLLKPDHELFFADIDTANWQQFYRRWTLAEAVTKAEQGLLLQTLKKPVGTYSDTAVYVVQGEYIFCCYSAAAAAQATTKLMQVSVSSAQLLFEAY